MSSYISVLGDDRMRIADKLLLWLKRRPTKETLQAKGILKGNGRGHSKESSNVMAKGKSRVMDRGIIEGNGEGNLQR